MKRKGLLFPAIRIQKTTLFHLSGIIAVTFLACYPVLHNRLLDLWDDQWQVVNPMTEGGFSWNNLVAVFSSFLGGQYSPVNQFCYTAIYALCGYHPFGYHLFSLLLHAGCAVLVYFIAGKIWQRLTSLPEKSVKNVSLLTALLFSIHPLQVESVAWVSASKIVLFAFFYLVATLLYIRFIESKKHACYFLAVFCFALSFGAKEQAVIFPVWLLLLYWSYGYRLNDKEMWLHLLPFFVLSLFFGIVSIFSQTSNGGGIFSGSATYPIYQRFVLASYALTEYLTKWLFPVNLQYIYPFPFSIGEEVPAWLLAYPVILVLLVYFFRTIFRAKIVRFGFLFFLIHLLFVLHFVPISRFVVTADRYIYLSAIGLSLIIAYYLQLLSDKLKTASRKMLFTSFLVLYMAVLTVYSNCRCRVWYDSDTLKKEIREQLSRRDKLHLLEEME